MSVCAGGRVETRQIGRELRSPEVENKAERRSQSKRRSCLTSGKFPPKLPLSPEVTEGSHGSLRGRRNSKNPEVGEHDSNGHEVKASTRVRQVPRCKSKEVFTGPRTCQPRE